MTSIVGVRFLYREKPIIMLGADTQSTTYDEDGEVQVAKSTARKIWVGEKWAMAYAGTITEHLDELRKFMQGKGKNNSPTKIYEAIQTAINSEERYFDAIAAHTRRLRRKYSQDDVNYFILATQDPLELWYVNECGTMFNYKEFCRAKDKEATDLEFFVLGSGSDRMESYIETRLDEDDKKYFIDFSLAKAESEIVEILHRPRKRDPGTGGSIILATVTEKGVFDSKDRLERAARQGELGEAEDFGMEIQEALDGEE